MGKRNVKNLLKDGAPRYIRCYRNYRHEGPDQWTIVFTKIMCWVSNDKEVKEMYRGRTLYISLSATQHYGHGELQGRGSFGSRLRFSDLNDSQQRTVVEEYEACWNVKITMEGGVCTEIRERE